MAIMEMNSSSNSESKPSKNGRATGRPSPQESPSNLAKRKHRERLEAFRIAELGTVNRKPRFLIDSRSVINDKSEFREKLLCDGLTFTAGHSCSFSCSYCYVEGMLWGNQRLKLIKEQRGLRFEDFVIEIAEAPAKARAFLTLRGKPRFADPNDTRVIYASPLVDVAGTMSQVKDTVEICKAILELTQWQIRLLSKSSLLLEVAKGIPQQYRERMIYGLSTGTFDSGLARTFEKGTALVSKRVEALHWLQDNGFRTFGMLCPILPQIDYGAYAQTAAKVLRVTPTDNQHHRPPEHVWAEVLNVRGDSLRATSQALRQAGRLQEAALLERVMADKGAWEEYARRAFLALTEEIPSTKLRFLQYVNDGNIAWWQARRSAGAILLGKATHNIQSPAPGCVSPQPRLPLNHKQRRLLRKCEKIISAGAIPFLAVGLALKRIKEDKLYRETHDSFGDYCADRFDFQRAHAYRLLDEAVMVTELQGMCKNGDEAFLPRNEGQARELLSVPCEQRLPVLRLAASKGRQNALSARLIREAKTVVLGEQPPSTLQKKAAKRFSAEMGSFLRWLEQLKTALEEGRVEDALFMISEVERTRQILKAPLNEHKRKRSKRFPDAYDAGESQVIHSETGKARHALGKLRRLRNLADLPQLEAWASEHGFELSLEPRKEHWILKGENITAEWWPSTAKLVLNRKYAQGIRTHDWVLLCAILDEVQRTGKWNSVPFEKDSTQESKL